MLYNNNNHNNRGSTIRNGRPEVGRTRSRVTRVIGGSTRCGGQGNTEKIKKRHGRENKKICIGRPPRRTEDVNYVYTHNIIYCPRVYITFYVFFSVGFDLGYA